MDRSIFGFLIVIEEARQIGWESKFGMTEFKTADIFEFRNFDY